MGASYSSGWSQERDHRFARELERLFIEIQDSLTNNDQYNSFAHQWVRDYDLPNIFNALDWVKHDKPELTSKCNTFRKKIYEQVMDIMRQAESRRRYHDMLHLYRNLGRYRHPHIRSSDYDLDDDYYS